MAEARTTLHDKGSHQQDASQAEVVLSQIARRRIVLDHLSLFKEIVSDLESMEVNMMMRIWVLFFYVHCLVLFQISEIPYYIVEILSLFMKFMKLCMLKRR